MFLIFIFHSEPEKEVTSSQGESVVPVVAEQPTIKPEMAADPVKVAGSSDVVNTQSTLPMINADFIQQFQNALHSISGRRRLIDTVGVRFDCFIFSFLFRMLLDPKARTLQEEFLRLQQQLLTLQMQAIVQQSNTLIANATESVPVVDKIEVAPVAEKIEAVPVTQNPKPVTIVDTVDATVVPSDRIQIEEKTIEVEISKAVTIELRKESSVEVVSEPSDIVQPPVQYETQQKYD